MEDFKSGLYPEIKYQSEKPLFPVVVTLEEWFIYGDLIVNKLNEFVLNRLKKVKLREDLITTNPYCVISAETFEKFVYIANRHDIKEVLGEKVLDEEEKYWETENYLRHKYPEEIKQTGCPFIPELNMRIEAMLSSNKPQ